MFQELPNQTYICYNWYRYVQRPFPSLESADSKVRINGCRYRQPALHIWVPLGEFSPWLYMDMKLPHSPCCLWLFLNISSYLDKAYYYYTINRNDHKNMLSRCLEKRYLFKFKLLLCHIQIHTTWAPIPQRGI